MIKEGQFMQSESVDESIEFRGEERVEIVVVFVAGC
jgi:hypothetical protein